MLDLIECVIWPIGSALGDIFLGLWEIVERDGKKEEKPVRVKRTGIRGLCAYCRKKGSALVKCAECAAPHHQDCARANGRCAVYGCGTRSFRVPAA